MSNDFYGLMKPEIKWFEKKYGAIVTTNIRVLDECDVRIMAALDNLGNKNGSDLNEYKIGGTICYYIRKLKPFRVRIPSTQSSLQPKLPQLPARRLNGMDPSLYVNEILAFEIAETIVYGRLSANKQNPKIKTLAPRYYKDIIRTLRYSNWSPHSLIVLYEGLCL